MSLHSFLKSTRIQLSSIIVVAVYIGTLLIWQYTENSYAEPIPPLKQVSEKVKRLASDVEVGMHVNGFPAFSFANNSFTLDAIVWFKYQKATEALSTIEQFSIQNSKILQGNTIIYKSAPIVRVLGKYVVVSYHIQASFMTYLRFKRFPLGDHRLNIILQNKSVTSREIAFRSNNDNVTLASDLLVDDWAAVKSYAKGGYEQAQLKKNNSSMVVDYPCVIFSIDFSSIGARSLFTLYFPLFVVFFLGLLSMTIDLLNFSRLGIIASSLPMLVLFRMVIESSSPAVGYATHIDFTYYTLVFLSLLILLLQMYIVLEAPKIDSIQDEGMKTKQIGKIEKVNNYAFFGILMLLVLFMTYNFLR